MDVFRLISEILEHGDRCVVITAVSKSGEGPAAVGSKMLVKPDGSLFGTVGGGSLEYLAAEKGKSLLAEGRSLLEKYNLQEGKIVAETQSVPMICGGEVTLFYEFISGGTPLWIFGGGHIGEALCRIIRPAGFYTHVIDNRKEIHDRIDFADAAHFSEFPEFISSADITDESFVVICTPSHKYDFDVAASLMKRNIRPKYTGMLASRTKLKQFSERFEREYGNNDFLSQIYSPVGLDIGGASPAEIAVSIAAEIIAVKYGKTGNRHMGRL